MGRLHVDVRRHEFESNADAARRPHSMSGMSGLDQHSYDSHNDAPGKRYFFTSPRHPLRLDERTDLESASADRADRDHTDSHRQATSTRPYGVGSSFALDGMKRTNDFISVLDDNDVHRKDRRRDRDSATAAVRVERDLYEQEVSAKNAEIDSLRRQLLAAQEELKNQRDENDLLKKECEEALEDALQEVDHLKREITYTKTEAEQELTSTKTEAEQLKEDVKDLTSENVILRVELDHLRNDTGLNDLKRELDRAEDKAQCIYEEKVRLEKNYKLILREKVECEEAILRGKVECEGKVDDARHEAHELARDRSRLEKEVGSLQEELAAVRARCEDDLSRRDGIIRDLEGEVVQLAKGCSASRERDVLFDEMTAALEVAAREKDEMRERHNGLLEEARDLRDKNMAGSHKVDFVTKERDGLSRAVADLEGCVAKQRDEHARAVADLERTISKLKEEKGDVTSQRNDLREELIMVLESVSDVSAGAEREYRYD